MKRRIAGQYVRIVEMEAVKSEMVVGMMMMGGRLVGGGLVVHIRVTKHIDFSPMATLFTSESHKTATNKQAPEICHTSLVPWSSTRVIRNEGIFYGYMHISKSKGP